MPCREEDAVSVLTPPKLAVFAREAPRDPNEGVHLCWSREPAGRAARIAERANTIVNVMKELVEEKSRKK